MHRQQLPRPSLARPAGNRPRSVGAVRLGVEAAGRTHNPVVVAEAPAEERLVPRAEGLEEGSRVVWAVRESCPHQKGWLRPTKSCRPMALSAPSSPHLFVFRDQRYGFARSPTLAA